MKQTFTVPVNEEIGKLVLVSECHLYLYTFFFLLKRHVSPICENVLNELKILLKCNPCVIDSDKHTYLENSTEMLILNKSKYHGI